jgi:hypothetical protein
MMRFAVAFSARKIARGPQGTPYSGTWIFLTRGVLGARLPSDERYRGANRVAHKHFVEKNGARLPASPE